MAVHKVVRTVVPTELFAREERKKERRNLRAKANEWWGRIEPRSHEKAAYGK